MPPPPPCRRSKTKTTTTAASAAVVIVNHLSPPTDIDNHHRSPPWTAATTTVAAAIGRHHRGVADWRLIEKQWRTTATPKRNRRRPPAGPKQAATASTTGDGKRRQDTVTATSGRRQQQRNYRRRPRRSDPNYCLAHNPFSDNGTEFRNVKLQSFLEDVGISHNLSAVRTPQQNGVVERMNRTLVEAARSMMAHSGVPQSIWAEAISIACFTQNQTLIVKRTGKTAYEMIEQCKPNIDYFRVFGCKCYVLNDRNDLGKFDPKSDESIFIGYSLNSMTYRVSNKRTRTILKSSNVDFSETETYCDACPSNPNALLPELSTAPLSIDFACNSFASDFIDPADYDLPTLTGPIVVPAYPGSSTTSVSSDAFVTEPSSSTSTDSVTRESVVSPQKILQQNPQPLLHRNLSKNRQHLLFLHPFLKKLHYLLRTPLKGLMPSSSGAPVRVHDENDASNNQQAYVTLPHTRKWTRDHPSSQIIGSPSQSIQTRSSKNVNNLVLFGEFLSDFEPSDVQQALFDSDWVRAMQEELAEFKHNKMDVKCAFLNGVLQEEVYVEQPEGFVDPRYPSHAYVLDKALYGLKQAPRAWYETLTIHLLEAGYKKGTIDPTLFVHRSGSDLIIVQIYVDDIIFASTKPELCKEFENTMKSQFQISMMGELNSAATPMPKSFHLNADLFGKLVDQKNYRAIIGSLLYLTASRPDIVFSTGVCARYQCDPRDSLLTVVKRILRYLKGIPDFGLWYLKDSGFELIAYTDSDHAGCSVDENPTGRLRIHTMQRIPIYCDSKSAIPITANPIQHSRTKHIDIRYHFIKDHVEKGNIEPYFVESDFQLADMFTKPFDEKRHFSLLNKLGMLDLPPEV
ncbi:hypothetical protein OSB04_024175 [Centaurea solstitialis]|uniref:Integrase catalytic domain-containing protein n=1 Tax=Centaurea solstitialis TaxID=347529 RepID=A0AA38SL84_9ASTR|nr:hypothetical protein OSB04_024175 [Centaurea solstitialis]